MIIPGLRLSVLFFVLLLIACSGCTTVQQQVNNTPDPEATIGNPATVTDAPLSTLTPIVTGAASPLPETRARQDQPVLRGKPFTIGGTVNNRSITKVQVWILNGTIATRLVPIGPDGTFQAVLSPGETAALPRTFTAAMVVQYPSPPDQFAVAVDPYSGKIIGFNDTVPPRILSELNDKGYYPTTEVDFLDQAISGPLTNNSCDIFFLNGVDALIELAPIRPGPPGTLGVSGNTGLPAGTPLYISVITASTHPTPQNYDYSHEITDGTAVVATGTGGVNHFYGTIDTSRLNTGKYMVSVNTNDDALKAYVTGYTEIIAQSPQQTKPGNYINWSQLTLPALVVNTTISPEMLDAGWQIVEPGTQVKNNEVPYSSIIDCGPDAVCRVFDKTGVQFLAVYNSNEARMMGVPDGAAIDSGSIGNVTLIKLNGETILTKIDEYSRIG
jgi:hypothetical protein